MKKNQNEQIIVKFGPVMIGANVQIPITIKRADAALARVDYLFAGERSISGSVVGRPEGCHATQNGVFGDDGDIVLHGVFEVSGYHASAKEFTATLKSDVVRLDALKLRGRNGLLKVEKLIERKPAEAPAEEEAVA